MIDTAPVPTITSTANPFKIQLALRIGVMQAYLEGKKIEFRQDRNASDRWEPVVTPSWNWERFEYRVAPPPLVKRWALENPADEFFSTYDSQSNADRANERHFDGQGRVFLLREVR